MTEISIQDAFISVQDSAVEQEVLEGDTIQFIQGVGGIQGATGHGVPTGGTDGQYLRKVGGVNYVTTWTTLQALDISDFTEAAQDAVGNSLVDGSIIDFTYNDLTNTITADIINGSIGTDKLSFDPYGDFALKAGDTITGAFLFDDNSGPTVNVASDNIALTSGLNSVILTAGGIVTPQTNAADSILRSYVHGDIRNRFEILTDGEIQWGDGTNLLDTTLYRSSANTLTTNSTFKVDTTSLSGIVTTIDGAGIGVLASRNIGTSIYAGNIDFSAGDAGDVVVNISNIGEVSNRFSLNSIGALQWGNGTDPVDTNLYRGDVNTLKTSSNFVIDDGSTNVATLSSSYVFLDGGISGISASLSISGLTTIGDVASADVLQSFVVGDNANRFEVHTDGEHRWGDGTGILDTNLYRAAANLLQTDDTFNALVLQQNGTNISSLFDAAGSSATKVDKSGDTMTGALVFDDGSGVTATFGGTITLVGPTTQVEMNTSGVSIVEDSTSSGAVLVQVTGELVPRFYIAGDGATHWGTGAGVQDTNLYRQSSGYLKTDGTFEALTLKQNGSNISSLFDAAGSAAAAQSAAQSYALGLVDDLSGVSNASQARTNLGLGTAATQNSTAFDSAGSAASAQSAAQAYADGLVDDLSGVTNAATARTNLGLGSAATLAYDTDVTLSANSDSRIATQKAIKAYADSLIATANAVVYKGTVNCSTNPNYPAANSGDLYVVSVAGKIGGASGIDVEIGDLLLCNTDGTVSGNQATVGTYWNIIEKNIVGAVSGPSSAVSGNVAVFSGTTGKLIADGGTLGTAAFTASTAYDAAGAAAAAQSAAQSYADGLVDDLSGVTNAATARTNLGLGSAATQNTSAFDAAGAASSAVSAHVLAVDPHGDRAYADSLVDDLSGVTNAATARTNLGLGSAATYASTAFDAAGAAAAAQSAAQSYADGLVDDLSGVTNAATARTNLGLGTAATYAYTAFDAAGAASTAVAAHVAASDPHGDRAYAAGLVDDLSGVTDATTARTNLGLGSASTSAATDFVAVIGDTMAGELIIQISAAEALAIKNGGGTKVLTFDTGTNNLMLDNGASLLVYDDSVTPTGATSVLFDEFRSDDYVAGNYAYLGYANGLRIAQDTSTSPVFRTFVSGESQYRLIVDTTGKMLWSDGTLAGDTNLYRSAADTLKTDDTFDAATLKQGGTAITAIMDTKDNNVKAFAVAMAVAL